MTTRSSSCEDGRLHSLAGSPAAARTTPHVGTQGTRHVLRPPGEQEPPHLLDRFACKPSSKIRNQAPRRINRSPRWLGQDASVEVVGGSASYWECRLFCGRRALRRWPRIPGNPVLKARPPGLVAARPLGDNVATSRLSRRWPARDLRRSVAGSAAGLSPVAPQGSRPPVQPAPHHREC